uniref:Mitochondrial import inner membrane translocase subunit TIM9 n=1 Tax=Steinernema glaseri TaxID=37863 RepID=A0A1I7ZJL8_9BILA
MLIYVRTTIRNRYLSIFMYMSRPTAPNTTYGWKFNFNRRRNPNITPEKMENIEKAKMTPEQFKRVEHLHMSWYTGAVSGLLGAVGRDMYTKMDRENREAFIQCLDVIEEDSDLKSSAKCLT